MPEQSPTSLDLSRVEDPEVRRALRAIHADLGTKVTSMQVQIDALLELLIEKHVGSIGEFRRQMARLQQNHGRVERLHGAMATPPAAPGASAAQAAKDTTQQRFVL